MSFATDVAKSVSDPRVLVELDIGTFNVQWVNNGAGIWAVNADNLYAWVDSTLLEEGFTAQGFGAIGSVKVDALPMTRVDTLATLDIPNEFFYDVSGETLYCIFPSYDEPSLHSISIGVIYGYSFDAFTPVGFYQSFEARLLGAPTISIARDPLFFGRLAFGGGTIQLANADGEFDTFARDNDIYGNEARVKLGFDSLDYDDYQTIFTGYIEGVTISEDTAAITIADRRKQLTRPIQYATTGANPVAAIQDILETYFLAQYDTDYFDTTKWAAALSACTTIVTLDMQEESPAIDVIEGLCLAAPGVFYVNPSGKYAFQVYDPDATVQTTIASADILGRVAVSYDPTEVISSIRVGHSAVWGSTSTVYTYTTYDTYEASVFSAYKTYREQSFDTYLPDATTASVWAGEVYPRFTSVHGATELDLPIAYYDLEIGETADVVLNRPVSTMLGTVTTEIMSIGWELSGIPRIKLGLRIV